MLSVPCFVKSDVVARRLVMSGFFAYAIVLGILMRGVNPDITQLFTLERDLYEQCPQTFGWFMDQKH